MREKTGANIRVLSQKKVNFFSENFYLNSLGRPLNTEILKSLLKKSIFKIDLFEQKALFDPKMNWFLPKTDTTRTFFCERMT